jgi:hypothetical protein
MPATLDPQNEPLSEDSRNDIIARHVIHALGSPKNLLKVKVHPVGGDRFRVNIMTGADFSSGRIANSYFLTANSHGKILSSTPQIVKLY